MTEPADIQDIPDQITEELNIEQAPADLEPPAVAAVPPSSPAPHPLAPGGKRFEQVYARAKQTERELAQERERRIAAEARLEQATKPGLPNVTNEIEYSWAQLEEFIKQGRVTLAEAQEHREKVAERKIRAQLKAELATETKQQSRGAVLDSTVQAYIAAKPSILEEGSTDRQRLDEEFEFIASVQGVDTAKLSAVDRQALQLVALRNVYGPVDRLQKTEEPMRGTHEGLPGGTPPVRTPNPDQAILNKLTKGQVEHYQKMMRAGRYPKGWADVVEELKFDPHNRQKPSGVKK